MPLGVRMRSQTKVVVIALVLSARSALGCICVSQTPKQAFKSADVVVVGEITAHESGTLTLHVTEHFKGRVANTMTIATERFENCVGNMGMDVGASYVMYASVIESVPGFVVDSCSRTGPTSRFEADIRLLRRRAWWWRLAGRGLRRTR